jgi:hypothetical protein
MHRSAVVAFLALGWPEVLHAAGEARLPLPPAASADDLLRRIEGLERDNADMRQEIGRLRAQVGGDWLTQERSAQIREIVTEVLADADTRASLTQDGLTAGWSEHFFLSSPDGRFKLQLEGVLQIRWLWNFHDQPDRYQYGFENTRTKLILAGHVFTPGLTYRIQGEWGRAGGSDTLEDAWVRYQLDDEWAVRIGQFKLPFNYEELVRSWNLQVIERSLVNESLNIGRSQGIELQLDSGSWRWALAVSDGGEDNIAGGGLIGSRPANTPWSTPNLAEFAFTSRLEHLIAGRWDQFDQFTSPPGEAFGALLGIAGHIQQDEFGTGFANIENEEWWMAATADASIHFGGANLFGSVTYHYLDDPQSGIVQTLGAVLQGGAYFSSKFEAYARLEYGFFDFDVQDLTDLWLLTLGGNYYFDGQDVKLSADIGFGLSPINEAWNSDLAGWRTDGPGAEPQVVIRVQLQLLF